MTITFRFFIVKAERTPSTMTMRTAKFVYRRQVNDYHHAKTCNRDRHASSLRFFANYHDVRRSPSTPTRGCIKFLYDLCTTTVAKTGPTSTPTTCVPLPSSLEDSADVKFLAVNPNI